MESVDQTEMSAPREAMLRRRRRSLSVLAVGSVISVLLAGVTGGAIWLIAGAFVLGTVGYFYSCARRRCVTVSAAQLVSCGPHIARRKSTPPGRHQRVRRSRRSASTTTISSYTPWTPSTSPAFT